MNHATHPSEAEVGGRYGMTLTVGDHSARHLRRILRQYLANWSMTELVDDAELALTELMANVVRHVPGRTCRLVIFQRAGGLRVELTDDCPKLPAMPAHPDELAESGRGLLIVATVANRWGVVSHAGGGKTVWFECDTSGEPE
ncbi:ATP-binding protein [Streptomyces sp. NPDC059994]|uniref:ATP-binding protein n=1 Tax=Streptomyces sp. NPDC059994 TaxID=3347029 RepID=UPI0036A56227